MTNTLHVFTCAAVNYLPKVRILCRSIRQHHPEAVIHLALADQPPEWLDIAAEPFDSLLPLGRLGIPNAHAWSFTHSIVELSTAIKPYALRHLLGLPDCGAVLYFDPDMVLFSRVDDILGMLGTSNLVLTPHLTHPEQSLAGILDNEVSCLRHGIFNLGFIAVANTGEGRRFADWWAERLYRFCRADVENGLFTDQKWVDFAPVFFDDVAIMKSSRHNVATWNLATRRVTGNFHDGFEVDGEPLGFYHFTGFDSGAHRIMAEKYATASPAVQELIAWYEKQVAIAESDPISRWPWAYGRFSDGTPVEPCHRWLYREHSDLQRAFPDPYDAEAGATTYLAWCHTEGARRYPEFFGEKGDCRTPARTPLRSAVGPETALRMALLMLRPRRGAGARKKLRDRLRQGGLWSVLKGIRRNGMH